MKGTSLAVKYRPQELSSVVGQDIIVKILKKQLETNTIKNCYLFCGKSGVGKTTLGKLLAKEINKGTCLPIEIDAASHNGVDDVRALIESGNTRSMLGEYKVFILDECHSLSNQAWQALLKTLEEPNSKTIFIFCTTEVNKVPNTILNRVQRFDLKKISNEDIFNRLKYICKNENINYADDALMTIAKMSKGQMRDAITNLERTLSLYDEITTQNVLEVIGSNIYEDCFKLFITLLKKDSKKCLEVSNSIDDKGVDFKTFTNTFISFLLDINKYIISKDLNIIQIPMSYQKLLEAVSNQDASGTFSLNTLKHFLVLRDRLKSGVDPKTDFDIALLILCR